MRGVVVRWGAAGMLGAALSWPALAQLQNCPPGAGTDLKVYVDDFYFADDALRADRELRRLHDRLISILDTHLATLGVEDLATRPVRCPSRRPVDGSEFDRARAADLNARGVILELWGLLDATKTESGDLTDRSGVVRFAIHPLRHYGFFTQQRTTVPGVYATRLPRSGSRPDADFLELMGQTNELAAYAAIGIGLRKAQANDADATVKYMSRAEHELSLLTPATDAEKRSHEALVAYVRSVRCEAYARTVVAAVTPGGAPGTCR